MDPTPPTTAPTTPQPPVTRFAPAFICKGYLPAKTANGQRRYVIEVAGVVRVYRAQDLHGVVNLSEIASSAYWRLHYPRQCRTGVDTMGAVNGVAKLCVQAGIYRQPIPAECDLPAP